MSQRHGPSSWAGSTADTAASYEPEITGAPSVRPSGEPFDAGAQARAPAPPTIISMVDLGPSLKLPQEEISCSRRSVAPSVGGWSEISALLRTEMAQQQQLASDGACAPDVGASGGLASGLASGLPSPMSGIGAVSTTATRSTAAPPVVRPMLDPCAKPWAPSCMAASTAPITPALSPVALMVNSAPTYTPSSTDEQHGNQNPRPKQHLRLQQLSREIENTESERKAMGLAPLQHDTESFPTCCETCHTVRGLRFFFGDGTARLKVKVVAEDFNGQLGNAQRDRPNLGLPTTLEDADASPTLCQTCGSNHLLRLLVIRSPGHMKIKIGSKRTWNGRTHRSPK